MPAYSKAPAVDAPYRERSVKIPALITVILLALIAGPLGYWVHKTNALGERTTNISSFTELTTLVSANVKTVNALLSDDAEALAAINASRRQPVVTLIVPEVVIVDEKKPSAGMGPLKVELEGVYWSATRPLVNIDGETYGVGDVIQGYEITRIGKTSAQFQAPNGTIVVKDMYESLLQSSKD